MRSLDCKDSLKHLVSDKGTCECETQILRYGCKLDPLVLCFRGTYEDRNQARLHLQDVVGSTQVYQDPSSLGDIQ